MSLTTPTRIRSLQRKLYREAKTVYVPGLSRNTSINWPHVVCLAVKPVGEPDAGDRHVRFDERGWETGRWPLAPSYRAHPRLCHRVSSPRRINAVAIGGIADVSASPAARPSDGNEAD